MQTLDYSPGKTNEINDKIAIRTYGLSKQFKKRRAVNNVELEVHSGEVFGLLGPNGAGKTTIIRMLLGLIEPSAGRAMVLGCDPAKDRAAVLARVAAIIEAPALYPMLTARDNLKAVSLVAGINNPRKIEEVLDLMGLTARAKDKYSTYSLGMKQRLCIAAALLTDPELLILDEPTNGLDPAGMAEIRHLLKELVEQGRTIVLCSHLLNEVQQVCNRVAVIQQGQIIKQGLVSELLAGKSAIHIKMQANDWSKAWYILQNQGWRNRVQADGEYLVIEGSANEGTAINRALATNGIFVGEIALHNQSLEEFYLALTNPSTSGREEVN